MNNSRKRPLVRNNKTIEFTGAIKIMTFVLPIPHDTEICGLSKEMLQRR